MSVFTPLPLGRRIPDKLHAVSVSLPTMADLRAYEERKPEVLARLPSGYPRFVVHPLVRTLAAHLRAKAGLEGRKLWLVSSQRQARALYAHLGIPEARLFEVEGLFGLSHPEDPALAARVKTYLQHTGGFLSSRCAEETCVRLGLLPCLSEEEVVQGEGRDSLWRHLGPLFAGAEAKDAFFCNAGINAVYSAFRAVSELQASRGRHLWVQLGWLYLDTIAILRKFSSPPGSVCQVKRVDDREALEKLFAEQGSSIAGILAEVPTNPLIQTPDLPWLAELADRHGAHLLLDPSVSSVYAVDLFPWADILVTSLTKYTAHEGDVLAGLAVVNPRKKDAADLRSRLGLLHEPLSARDACRLAFEAGSAPEVFQRLQHTTRRVLDFLEVHPAVRAVHSPRSPAWREHFRKVAREPEAVGGLLSFELRGPMEGFHDAVRLPKGPSFGLSTTLLCPFIWLAHYDLVTTDEGRRELASAGIAPDLLRLAPGAEDPERLLEALEEGFQRKRAASTSPLSFFPS